MQEWGYLEELKENKKIPSVSSHFNDENYMPRIDVEMPNTSILEKLRYRLEYEYNNAHTKLVHSKTVESLEYSRGQEDAFSKILTSLETPPEEFDTKQERISYRDLCSNTETKEEPTHKWEHQNDVCSKVTPQFTPWQEIEVSDDWDKWYTSVFEKKEFDGFRCKHDWLWLFARPIEDKIELLPAYEPSEPDWRDTQISLLTRTVNQLISK